MIKRITTAELEAIRPQLTHLLRVTVEAGASIGFIPPVTDTELDDFWSRVFGEVGAGHRILLCAFDPDIVGTVQLGLAQAANGRHRAEVQKLMVLPEARGRGVARELMRALEDIARSEGRTLLLLDTREGDAAEQLYQTSGWTELGKIPGYVRDQTGEHATVVYYRSLQ